VLEHVWQLVYFSKQESFMHNFDFSSRIYGWMHSVQVRVLIELVRVVSDKLYYEQNGIA